MRPNASGGGVASGLPGETASVSGPATGIKASNLALQRAGVGETPTEGALGVRWAVLRVTAAKGRARRRRIVGLAGNSAGNPQHGHAEASGPIVSPQPTAIRRPWQRCRHPAARHRQTSGL